MARSIVFTRPARSRRLIAGVGVVGVSAASAVVGLSSAPAQAADVDRIGGSDRIATSIAAYESNTSIYTPGSAVIARADGYADALVAGSAAAAAKAPLFLTPSGSLDPRVTATLKEHGITRVAVIGGPRALSADVESALKAAGITTGRVAGADRFDTARRVAGFVLQGTGRTSSPVFLATGTNYVDALAAVPAAHKSNAVILLTANKTLDAATAAYLKSSATTGVVAVGGPAAAAAKAHGINATPLIGANRFETATLLANTYFADAKRAYLASGTVYADAMAGGPLAALTGAPIVMTLPTALPAATKAWLDAANVPVTVLGGPRAVSTEVAGEVDAVVGTPAPSPTSSPSAPPTTSAPPSGGGGGGGVPISDPVGTYRTLRAAALASTRTATLSGNMTYDLATTSVTATGSPSSDVITARVAGATFKRDAAGAMTVNASATMWRLTPWADRADELAGKDVPVTDAQVTELTGLTASELTMRGLLSRALTENGPFGTELTGGSVTASAISTAQGNSVSYAGGLPTGATDGKNQSVTIAWQ